VLQRAGRELEEFREALDALVRFALVDPLQRSDELEVLFARELLEQRTRLGHVADDPFHLERIAHHVEPADHRAA